MADWDRGKALIRFSTTPLGADALIPTSITATETISGLFQFDIEAISQSGVIDPNQMLNQPACITLQDAEQPIRYFHGIVRDLRSNGIVRGKSAVDDFQSYSMTLVPRLWFLQQTIDCRVYQNKSSDDILKAMFQDAGLTDYTFSASAGASRPYTVQFNESDHAFAMRLMEEEGWFYFFQHSDSKHTLIVTDQNATFQDIPNATLHFAANVNDIGGILDWKAPNRTAAGSVALGDYDPAHPGTKLQNKQTTVLKAGGIDTRDEYHWPALTGTVSVVEARAKHRIEAAEAAVSLYHGASHFGALVPGGKFTITNAPAGPYDGTYAVRSVRHIIQDDSWMSSGGAVSYRNEFEAFTAQLSWREPVTTPKPRMAGIHSALVMGPQSDAKSTIKMQDGEEIYTDNLARVKIRFFWDWRAEATGSASIWARVVQPWAGNGWGAQFLPRVGTEVAVAFADGDPDRPIVIGGLYNGSSAPIYAPADKTKSGFRTRSSLKGDSSKANELTFDDKAGQELIFVHAEKDLTTEVENDQTLTVDNCRVVTVKADQTVTVTKNHSFEVKQGNATYKISMGNHSTEVSMGNHDLKLPLGNVSVKAELGTISLEAMQSISLKVGQSSITLDQTGVTIKGMMISVQGEMQTELKGLMTSVGGDAMLTLKGGITMIN